ncbi:hypothetical protein JR316_0009910 [Psilocybe cubensis]|uniref:Uncharacterized protein n=1 Tax=Psilocybe cubensis TaxID=181762 RepID=A0ACB8GQ26_PSICU|nr:hypothetical protein JR316_0009910 [Psilocybe cubensis]KAH9477684.1 hypothetical protein JR316_0009910 [Psilocybe cubensis]
MNIPLQSATTWKAVVTVLQLLAIAITALRLFLRHRRQTLWVDDITVALALVMELVGMIVMWFVYVQDDNSTVKGRVALYWFASIAWITTLWLTRITMILSITRIFPDWGTIRRNCRGIAISFGIFYIGFICWLCTSACVPSSSDAMTSRTDILDCSNERHFLVIASFSADIFSCCVLVLYPMFILFVLPLSRGQYKLVMGLLIAFTLVLLSSIVFGVFSYSPNIDGPGQPFVTGMLSQLEAVLSLLSCNVVAFTSYLFRNGSGADATDDRIEWKKPASPTR